MKSVFPWYGGKALLAPWIIKYFPSHEVYVEPFGGAASVLLAKEPCKVEVYNDANRALVNFFRVLRSRSEELYNQLALTPYAIEEYRDADARYYSGVLYTDELLWALDFFTIIRMVFGADMASSRSGSWKRQIGPKKHHSCKDWIAAIERLPSVAERLLSVMVECDDFEKLLVRYDRPGTLFYLDPPYLECDARYSVEFDKLAHVRMLECIVDMKGMIVLSGYANLLYEAILEDDCGWERVEKAHSTHFGSRNRNADNRRTECLWLNPATLRGLGIEP